MNVFKWVFVVLALAGKLTVPGLSPSCGQKRGVFVTGEVIGHWPVPLKILTEYLNVILDVPHKQRVKKREGRRSNLTGQNRLLSD